MSKVITLGAMGAEKLQKQKCKEFCGTPCKLQKARTDSNLFPYAKGKCVFEESLPVLHISKL